MCSGVCSSTMSFKHDGFNISLNARLFNSMPHLHLTSEGLVALSNTTFDYDRVPYTNALLVTFVIPFGVLLLVLTLFALYLLLVRCISGHHKARRHSSTQLFALCTVLCNDIEHQHRKASIDDQRANSDAKCDKSHSCRITANGVSGKSHRRCHGLFLAFGLCAVVSATYGTWLLNQGFCETDQVLKEFIEVVVTSKQAIGNFSQSLLPKPSASLQGEEYYEPEYFAAPSTEPRATTSALQMWMPRTYSFIQSYANYGKSSSENILHFKSHLRHVKIVSTTIDALGCLLCAIFWLMFIAVDASKLSVRPFILLTFVLLLVMTLIFDLNFTFDMVLSDFCLSAKPSILDIVVHKIRSNNLTVNFVNYYLHCELNQLPLEASKNAVLGYLDRLDSLQIFNASQTLSGLVSGVRSGIEHTYDTLHCVEANRLINRALTQLCTTPVDAFTITTFSYLFSIFLLVIVLFMVLLQI